MPGPKESPRLSLRIPAALMRAAKARASDLDQDLPSYIRGLIAADLGEEPPAMPRGIATLGARAKRAAAKRAGAAGAAARWGDGDTSAN